MTRETTTEATENWYQRSVAEEWTHVWTVSYYEELELLQCIRSWLRYESKDMVIVKGTEESEREAELEEDEYHLFITVKIDPTYLLFENFEDHVVAFVRGYNYGKKGFEANPKWEGNPPVPAKRYPVE
jgi:hypothetical protein